MGSRLRRRLALLLALAVVPAVVAACIVSSGVRVQGLDRNRTGYSVLSPVKAHLTDGSTIVYPEGIVVDSSRIAARVSGQRVGPLGEAIALLAVPLDSVLGLESYENKTSVSGTVLFSTLGVAAG